MPEYRALSASYGTGRDKGMTENLFPYGKAREAAMRWSIVFSLLLLIPAPAALTDTFTVGRGIDTALECEKIKQKIRHIQSRMRSGYTRAQGERMEAELRRLRAMRRKACR